MVDLEETEKKDTYAVGRTRVEFVVVVGVDNS